MIQTKRPCAGSHKATICFILARMAACTIAIAVSLGTCGCDNNTKEGRAVNEIFGQVFPDPPVSVTFRDSLLKGYVLQVHNTSSNKHGYTVHVENKEKGRHKTYSVAIPPNDTQEIGILEISWAFLPGEDGCISVDGFRKKLYFEVLEGGQYRSWYGL